MTLETTVHNPGQRAPHRPGFRKTTCRSCGTSFQDLNGLQLCDDCMVDRVNGAGELELDDPDDVINWDTPRSVIARTARRQCRVCDTPYTVALDYDGPPLCEPCRADIPATKARVLAWLGGVLAEMDAALAAADAVATAHAPLWEKLNVAIGTLSEAELRTRWKARMADPRWRTLLAAYEKRERALAPLGERRAALEQALEVLS